MAWSDSEHDQVIKALAVVCEISGSEFTPAARQFIVGELQEHRACEVLAALRRCARECKGRLSLPDILAKLEEDSAKEKARLSARRMADESDLRREALTAGIPWELGIEGVRKALESRRALPAPRPPHLFAGASAEPSHDGKIQTLSEMIDAGLLK